MNKSIEYFKKFKDLVKGKNCYQGVCTTEIHVRFTFYISVKSSKIRLQGCDLFLSIRDDNAKDLDGCKAAAMSRTQFLHMVEGPVRKY